MDIGGEFMTQNNNDIDKIPGFILIIIQNSTEATNE